MLIYFLKHICQFFAYCVIGDVIEKVDYFYFDTFSGRFCIEFVGTGLLWFVYE